MVHLACKSGEMEVLESVLRRVTNCLSGDRTQITRFLTTQSMTDGLTALDYCLFRNRHDMAVILQASMAEHGESSSQMTAT